MSLPVHRISFFFFAGATTARSSLRYSSSSSTRYYFAHIFTFPPFSIVQVHILNESRGSTLEVVISRMKTRGSAVRFVLVSATVPNIKDIAAWIGNKRRDGAATVFEVRSLMQEDEDANRSTSLVKTSALANLLDTLLVSLASGATMISPLLGSCKSA